MPAPPIVAEPLATIQAKTPESEGKTPVIPPLLGSWADECCWSNSRQASEILGDVQDKKEENEYDDRDTPSEDMGQTQSMEVNYPVSPQSQPIHVTRCISFDPYNMMDPCVIHSCCDCPQCIEIYQHVIPAKTPQAVPEAPKAVSPGSPFETHSNHPLRREPHRPVRPQCSQVLMPNRNGELWDVDEEAQPQAVQQPLQTVFMPPPPPPRLMPIMLRQDGCLDADRVHACILHRWYNKLREVQQYFVAEDDLCPPPPTAAQQYLLDGWCEMAGAWWFSHFEHMQKKQRPYFPHHADYNCY